MAEKIPLEILEPPARTAAVRDFPVSVGLVFPDGELNTVPGGEVVGEGGAAIPFEAEATGWWDPGKTRVKWLLLHFRADTGRKYYFQTQSKPTLLSGRPLAVAEGGRVVVDTGPLRVTVSEETATLFESVALHETSILESESESLSLAAGDGQESRPGSIAGWTVAVEESTPARATIKAKGEFRTPDDDPLARIELRYQFFRNESFVRVYHTLTWMVKDPAIGASEYALQLRPSLGDEGLLRVGESDYSDEHTEVPWTPKAAVTALQDGPEHFSIHADGQQLKEGSRLGGWFALETADGRGISISLREAWQTLPTAFVARDGILRVEFWPSSGARMSFRPGDLMPPDFFNNATHWNRFKWVDGKGHFIHEYSKHPHYLHTAEGAARTHELTLLFYDQTSGRTAAELNSVTQHPIVVRQDARSAMRVPFMGFDLEPVREDHGGTERALEQLGRMAVGRWAKTHDYGLWRYGMMRWAGTGVSYRWMDGHQYDQQIIPWLLFIRGGGRHWYEEGEATARFAMDVATNHYNTRGFPTGYQASASGLPFPWHATFLSKAPKVHFLAYYYHLTGYRRAKEVMDEVIAGNRQRAVKPFHDPEHPHRRGHGRELYNMNVFWVNAYEETLEPEVREYARDWLELTMGREYNAELNVFRAPNIYLYPGLVLQHRLWQRDDLKALMLRNLEGAGYPDVTDGSVYREEDAPGCAWAYRLTGDRRYLQVGWDIARTLADLVPDHDWESKEVPHYPILGNSFCRQFLWPIITGYSHAARQGLKQEDDFVLRDTFISLPATGEGRVKGEVYLRPKQDGALSVRLIFAGRWGSQLSGDLEARAYGPDGNEAAHTPIPATARKEVTDRFYPAGWFVAQRGEVTLPAAKKGEVYRMTIEGDGEGDPHVLVLADADLVQRVDLKSRVFFYNLAGQYYVGTRIFTKATEDVITMANPYGLPFTIRDADTGEALHHFTMADRSRRRFHVGKGRMLRLTMTGRMDGRLFDGVSPFFARTRSAWFEPE